MHSSRRVERGFAFTASYEHLVIVDEFEFAVGASVHNVTWAMHTTANIALTPAAADGGGLGSAVLSLGGATLHATVIEPKGAVYGNLDLGVWTSVPHLSAPHHPHMRHEMHSTILSTIPMLVGC